MVSAKAFPAMTKPTGAICNLDCTYCHYLEKESLSAKSAMSALNEDILEYFVRQRIEAPPSDVVDSSWQGREPILLGVEYCERVVLLQEKHTQGKQSHNACQSNEPLLE